MPMSHGVNKKAPTIFYLLPQPPLVLPSLLFYKKYFINVFFALI